MPACAGTLHGRRGRVPAGQVRRRGRQARAGRRAQGRQRGCRASCRRGVEGVDGRRPVMRKRARPGKPILGVDIDNVLAESDARLRALFRKLYGITLKEHQMTQYDYMTYGVTEEQLSQVFRIFNVEACRTLKVVPGAKTAMQQLAGRYEIALVTSRNPESKASTEYRRVCGASTPKPPVAIERVTPHGRPDAARGVQPSLRGLDGETPSCDGLCGGRTRSKSNGFPARLGCLPTGPAVQ